MDSDTLFRYIVGYGLAIFSLGLITVIIARITYLVLQNVVHITVNITNTMKGIPSYLKSVWPKLKEALIIILCFCAFIAAISLMLYDCYGNSHSSYHDPDEYEEALQDSKWNVPSRYRE